MREYRVSYIKATKGGRGYTALLADDRWMAKVKHGHREWILTDSSEARVREKVRDFITRQGRATGTDDA